MFLVFLVVNKAPANFVSPITGAVLAVFPETGVYFLYMSNDGDVDVRYTSSITIPAKSSIVPIPQEYIEGLEETVLLLPTLQRVGGDVIIKSSTPDSTKKFKITVDDTGAISATEVT